MTGGVWLTAAASVFTVLILSWSGGNSDFYSGAGLLTALWSLVMMLRLMALTDIAPVQPGNLSGSLLSALHSSQMQSRMGILRDSLSRPFVTFAAAALAFALWQFFCAVSPASSLQQNMLANLAASNFERLVSSGPDFYRCGETLMAGLLLILTGFLWRSHAAAAVSRYAVLIAAGYAAAGLIAFAGLEISAAVPAVNVSLKGYDSYSLAGAFSDMHAPVLFDLVLLQSGVIGMGFLAVLWAVPVCCLCRAAARPAMGRLIPGAGILIGLTLIGSMFMPVTPYTAGFLALCWTGLLAAWGIADKDVLTRTQK